MLKHKTKTIIESAKLFGFLSCLAFLAFAGAERAQAASASLGLSPSSGSFEVDSTFDVSIFLNSQGNAVNTIDLALRFPPDRLQLVSSGTGNSIIGLWTSQPHYNNQTGLLELTGGVPGGVNVERGLVTTLTFRAKAVGGAVVRFERARVLLNDGLGTEALTQTQNSLYSLVLPPPAGPAVVSETHPDQTQWYRNNSVILRWGDEAGADAFSYMMSDEPIDVPDEISEGNQNEVIYRNLGDGRRYFHIRAMRGGQWGGTSHYAINIDTAPPAEFGLDIIPGARTTRRQPIIQFATTDALSGTDHFELKLVPLRGQPDPYAGEIFIEAQSPFIPSELEMGSYDVIVRAYDRAGNYREAVQRLDVTSFLLQFFSLDGLHLGMVSLPWWALLGSVVALSAALFVLARRMRRWHRTVDRRMAIGELPDDVRTQMEELKRYRERYGNLSAIVLLIAAALLSGASAQAQTAEAEILQRAGVVPAPIITTLSRSISNQEIFYVGGKSGEPEAQVVLYIQNEQTAETISEIIQSNGKGDWFYRHDSFLTPGRYILWAQSRQENRVSPPSPQAAIEVEETAIQLGATRISYATLYMVLFLASFSFLLALLLYVVFHGLRGRKKHRRLLQEISEAQESLRRGFAVLNRDVKAQLELIKRAKLSKNLSLEERVREEQLLKDLENIEQYVSKEIWDIENAERGG